jgi:Zinc-binding dehydrogenase
VRTLTDSLGAHSVLECVGTGDAIRAAITAVRPRGAVGRFGVPHHEAIPSAQPSLYANLSVSGGPAPARAYIEEFLPDVLEGRIEPGRVFDRVVDLDEVPDGYRAMNDHFRILADKLRVTCISTSLPSPSAQWPVRSTRKERLGNAMVAVRRRLEARRRELRSSPCW